MAKLMRSEVYARAYDAVTAACKAGSRSDLYDALGKLSPGARTEIDFGAVDALVDLLRALGEPQDLPIALSPA